MVKGDEGGGERDKPLFPPSSSRTFAKPRHRLTVWYCTVEVLVCGLGELALCDNQHVQTFVCHVGHLLFELVVVLHDLHHDDGRAFLQEGVLA